LGITMLAGGVTLGETVRLTLFLAVTLGASLSLGLLISVSCRTARGGLELSLSHYSWSAMARYIWKHASGSSRGSGAFQNISIPVHFSKGGSMPSMPLT